MQGSKPQYTAPALVFAIVSLVLLFFLPRGTDVSGGEIVCFLGVMVCIWTICIPVVGIMAIEELSPEIKQCLLCKRVFTYTVYCSVMVLVLPVCLLLFMSLFDYSTHPWFSALIAGFTGWAMVGIVCAQMIMNLVLLFILRKAPLIRAAITQSFLGVAVCWGMYICFQIAEAA